jgi:hypothetical protein
MTQPQNRTLACPLCAGTAFDQEQGKLSSKWGLNPHKMTMLICRNCRFVLHFHNKQFD